MSLEKSARSDSAQCARATVLKYCTPDPFYSLSTPTPPSPPPSSPPHTYVYKLKPRFLTPRPASETWQTTTDYLLDANNVGWASFFFPFSSSSSSASWPFNDVPFFFSVCRSRDL